MSQGDSSLTSDRIDDLIAEQPVLCPLHRPHRRTPDLQRGGVGQRDHRHGLVERRRDDLVREPQEFDLR